MADQACHLRDAREPQLRQHTAGFPGAAGTTVGVKFGQEVPLILSPHWLPSDLPHDRAAHLNDVNGGAYDGFGQGHFGDPWAYTSFEKDMIPTWMVTYAIEGPESLDAILTELDAAWADDP